ncbi:MAG TPA: DUF2934 domain-containing protein [Phycisphaerales bacterium]|nr:DUF2934 domain-containing protein [Phycisphaerales bacterium]
MARRSHQAEGSTTRSGTVEPGTVREALAELNSLRRTEAPRRRTLGRRPVIDVPDQSTTPATSAPTPVGAPLEPTPDQIRRRAYELWIARGCREGHDLEDWLDAERELRAEH